MRCLIPVMAGLCLVACFDPTLPASGLACSAEQTCPPGQYCHPDNICRDTPFADAGGAIDAAPDGPLPIVDSSVDAPLSSPDARLFDATPDSATAPDADMADGAPPPIVLELSASGRHTCVRFDTGDVRCWGWNQDGQLGLSSQTSIGDNEFANSQPLPMIGGAAEWVAVGGRHTCAILTGGTVRCWGRGSAGRLGYMSVESIGDNEHPDSVGPVSVGNLVTAISAGSGHTCAVLQGGGVRCWGYNGDGQLGLMHQDPIGDDELPSSTDLVQLGGTVEQIAAGGDHNCAILAGGTVRCWGRGEFGRLGYGNVFSVGDNEHPNMFGPVDLGENIFATQIVAGDQHTCALVTGANVMCWGLGNGGRLGYGDEDEIGDTETPASKGYVSVGGDVQQLAAGGAHTCAVLVGGDVRCWGMNDLGQLGQGNTDPIGATNVPSAVTAVSLGGPAVRIVAGSNHTCAQLQSGGVRCWGSGSDGQLGISNPGPIGDTELPSSAIEVPLL